MDARHSSLASAVGAQYISMPVHVLEQILKGKSKFVKEERHTLIT